MSLLSLRNKLCLKFLDKNNTCILNVGQMSGAMQEVILNEGERLVGVRSKMYDNGTTNSAYHCNLVLVIGKLEWEAFM